MKKFRNLRRISLPVSMEDLILNERQIFTTGAQRDTRETTLPIASTKLVMQSSAGHFGKIPCLETSDALQSRNSETRSALCLARRRRNRGFGRPGRGQAVCRPAANLQDGRTGWPGLHRGLGHGAG